MVTYADRPCAGGWQVSIDTVISLTVAPKNLLKLSDVKLDESRYEKRKDNHLENVYYYVDQNEGINWTVDTAQGIAISVEYYPSAKDAHLQCSAESGGGVSATPKPKTPVTRSRNSKPRRLANKFACPMHPEVVSSKRGVCPRCGMRLVNAEPAAWRPAATGVQKSWSQLSTRERMLEMERLAPSSEFTCLMHVEVREAQPGVCPKCGMPLTRLEPSVHGEYKLDMASDPKRPRPGEKVRLRFAISNPLSGEPVKDYVVTHEKLFHLFIVSQDLSEYQHIHPQLNPDGTFSVDTALPRTGSYKVHADFFPKGGRPQVIHREIVTAGYVPKGSLPLRSLAPDRTLGKTLDGMKIVLEPGGPLVAGALIPLTYRLTDADTGQPVRNLEPYLGAWGHTLILSADQSDYLHTHPSEMLTSGVEPAVLRGGPTVEFKAMFPAAGDYRIWTQFQRAGRSAPFFSQLESSRRIRVKNRPILSCVNLRRTTTPGSC
ncbi:MAG: hypothetical protein QOE77_3674 [Blastocatellia bacterium]|nr:hypothetical protein [Blastocatellia bacterium]